MIIKSLIAIIPISILLAIPFAFRQSSQTSKHSEIANNSTDKIVIITAHNETVKAEYEQAFKKYYFDKYGREVEFDYRSPGGSSDISRYISDRYNASFRKYFSEHNKNDKFDSDIEAAFDNSNVDYQKDKFSERQQKARQMFLNSDVGIGIDLMAGGGTFEQSRLANRGYAIDAKVKDRHPEYFKEDVIPQRFGGDTLYDSKGRYYGVVLATFGIACNVDRVRELTKSDYLPEKWEDLAKDIFYNAIVIADPTKSGSANKCLEIIIQQQMAQSKSPVKGWENGLNIIKRIIANARTITDSAGKVVRDISSGEAAAGMAIDTYGFTEQEWAMTRFPNKKSHFLYIPPKGGTAVSADPIQLLRGAPNKRVAKIFIDFLLSKEGQTLHIFKPNTPGGPKHHALQRPPIRRDVYTKDNEKYWSDIVNYNPYEAGESFVYRAELTGPYYNLIRTLIGSIMLQPQEEMKEAWAAIIEAGGIEKVPLAYKEFCKLPFGYNDCKKVKQLLNSGSNDGGLKATELTRQWSEFARDSYINAKKLAKEGK